MKPTDADAIDERLEQLRNKEFVKRLEKEGKHCWTKEAQKRLIEVVESYLRWALELPKTHSPCSTEREKVERRAKSLRDALLAYPERDLACLAFTVGYGEDPQVDFTTLLANTSRILNGLKCLKALPRQGLPRRVNVKFLVIEVARLYGAIGGNVTISRHGPFARVLMLVHEMVRIEKVPPKTPDLVRYAENHRAEIQKYVLDRPLSLADVPKKRPKNSVDFG